MFIIELNFNGVCEPDAAGGFSSKKEYRRITAEEEAVVGFNGKIYYIYKEIRDDIIRTIIIIIIMV